MAISYTKKGTGRVSGNKTSEAGYVITSVCITGRFPKGNTVKHRKLLKKVTKKTLTLKFGR